jgi:hypothetical protein
VDTHTQATDATTDPANRRSEPRRDVTGKVQLKFEKEPVGPIEVDLLDLSASGFRVGHRHGLLPLGAKAAFRHPEASGKARVVWNWMHPDHVESGFVVIR